MRKRKITTQTALQQANLLGLTVKVMYFQLEIKAVVAQLILPPVAMVVEAMPVVAAEVRAVTTVEEVVVEEKVVEVDNHTFTREDRFADFTIGLNSTPILQIFDEVSLAFQYSVIFTALVLEQCGLKGNDEGEGASDNIYGD